MSLKFRREGWYKAAVHWLTKSWTQLSNWATTSYETSFSGAKTAIRHLRGRETGCKQIRGNSICWWFKFVSGGPKRNKFPWKDLGVRDVFCFKATGICFKDGSYFVYEWESFSRTGLKIQKRKPKSRSKLLQTACRWR